MKDPMEQKSIDSLHRTKTGRISDKWSSYLTYYDKILAPLQQQAISMLEIGVQNGGSLDTWSSYFSAGATFIGCDIDPKCATLRYEDPRIHIVVGDCNSAPTFKQIVDLAPVLDLVIDDGSHVSIDIINAFINYFPLVKPGGIYVVEDTACLYLNEFGGGLLNDYGANAFFKRLIDVISFQFWKDELSINQYLRTFFDTRKTPNFILDGWIDSIEFRNSIITIRKSDNPGHEKLGARVVTGHTAQVQTWNGRLPT
jgi:hypothetical protein